MSIEWRANKENRRPVVEGCLDKAEGRKAQIEEEKVSELALPLIPLQLRVNEKSQGAEGSIKHTQDAHEEKDFELARPVTPPGVHYSMSDLEKELDAAAGFRTPERASSPKEERDPFHTPSPYKTGLMCLSSQKRTPSKVSPTSVDKIVEGYASLRTRKLDMGKLHDLKARYHDVFAKFLAKDAPVGSPLAHHRSVAYARTHDWIEDLLQQFHKYSITSIILFDIEHIVVGEREEKEGVGKLSGKHFFTPTEFQQMVVSHVTSTQGVTSVRWRKEGTDKIKASSIFPEGYTPDVFLKSFKRDAPMYIQKNRKIWSMDGMWVETYHRGFYVRSAFPIFFHVSLEKGKHYEIVKGTVISAAEILKKIQHQCAAAFSGLGSLNPIQFYDDTSGVCVFDIGSDLDIGAEKGVYIEVHKDWITSKEISTQDVEELLDEL